MNEQDILTLQARFLVEYVKLHPKQEPNKVALFWILKHARQFRNAFATTPNPVTVN